MSIIVGGRFWGVYVLENIDKRSKKDRKLPKHASCKKLQHDRHSLVFYMGSQDHD